VSSGQRMFHFANARQFASALARNRFVLHLDASDDLIALDIDFLNGQIAGGKFGSFNYWREFSSMSSAQGSLSYLESRFYNRELYCWKGYTHEAIFLEATSEHCCPACYVCTKQELFAPHSKDENKLRSYNLPALASDLLNEPDDARWQHYLGRELYYFHWYRSAIPLLEKSASAGEAWDAERSESWCLAGSCYEALEETERARQCYQRAVDIDGSRREPLIKLAGLSCRKSDFRASVEFSTAALEIPRTSGYMEYDANYTYVPHAILYWSLYWLGERKQARRHWERCIHFAPDCRQFREHAKLFGRERFVGKTTC